MSFWTNLVYLLILKIAITEGGVSTLTNITKSNLEKRVERSLIFEGGGTIKLNIGISQPVYLEDPISWRSLVVSYSLQGGHYALANKPLYPWDKWENIFQRSFGKVRSNFHRIVAYPKDDSRLFVYTALVRFLSSNSRLETGQHCLLQSICRNAQINEHVGVFANILNIILTPGFEDIEHIYKDAYTAGQAGVDCFKLYNQCARGSNFLEQHLHEF